MLPFAVCENLKSTDVPPLRQTNADIVPALNATDALSGFVIVGHSKVLTSAQ
jgi:hypothetical protein